MNMQEQKGNSLPLIYFVEDDQDDIDILQDILGNSPRCLAQFFMDAYQLVAHLEETTDLSLPALMVLDHHLPKWEGDTLLQALKQHPRYRSIPVMILSSTVTSSKKACLLNAGACKVEEKPHTLDGYNRLVRQLVALAAKAS